MYDIILGVVVKSIFYGEIFLRFSVSEKSKVWRSIFLYIYFKVVW